MSRTVIRVEGLGKLYYIGEPEKHNTLRDAISDFFRNILRKGNRKEKKPRDFIWALRDVSFEVKEGEVVGIIGRNGAGKSTLLKILSRITEPTTGYAEIHGRVGSLLEVGTGFHPELTGRENIYFSGALLGMKKREIDRKFDEIVAFADIEKFIDTPVKYYSSGMYVRLAFAVAAHLEPEILLVDEVLAVGDAAFQKKCLKKMGEVSQEGRTVLFVSHNMGMITSLCKRAILLENGRIVTDGPASDTVITYYTRDRSSPSRVDYTKSNRKVGDDLAVLLEAQIEDLDGNIISDVDIRQPFKIKMRYALLRKVPKPPYPNFHFFDSKGDYVFVTHSNKFVGTGTEEGTYEAECIVPGHLLNNGVYFIGLALTFTHNGIHVSFYEKDALCISVRDPIDETLEELRSGYSGPIPGPVRPKLEWKISRID